MALSSNRIGEIVGYREYEVTNKETGEVTKNCLYSVLVKQRPDATTKIPTECALFEVREENQVLGDKLKVGQKVTFWEEERQWRDKNGNVQRTTYGVNIEAV